MIVIGFVLVDKLESEGRAKVEEREPTYPVRAHLASSAEKTVTTLPKSCPKHPSS